jgi:anaerobic ribonucleoside-triphosphate reductase activating protein
MENSSILRIAGITKESVCDGPGIRFTIFVQGCFHDCPGCHNPQTHDPNGGYEITIAEILAMIDTNPLLDGVTFSGGEPFLQAGALAELAESCRQRGLSVMTYTGYYYDELIGQPQNADWQKLLQLTDILVDGPYIQEEATPTVPFLGSSNQRLRELRPRE